MKRPERDIYRDILVLGGFGLCNACRFAEWEGYSCCDAVLHCMHPLEVIHDGGSYNDHPNDVWQGADCWAFRPKRNETLSDLAAMAAIGYAGGMPHKNKRGEWVAITGIEF